MPTRDEQRETLLRLPLVYLQPWRFKEGEGDVSLMPCFFLLRLGTMTKY